MKVYILKIINCLGFEEKGQTVIEWSNVGAFSSEKNAQNALYEIGYEKNVCYDEGDYLIDVFILNEKNISQID